MLWQYPGLKFLSVHLVMCTCKALSMKIRLMLALSMLLNHASFAGDNPKRLERKAMKKADYVETFFRHWENLGIIKIDSIRAETATQHLNVYLNTVAIQVPAREDWIGILKEKYKEALGRRFDEYNMVFWTNGRVFEEYIPNALRSAEKIDHARIRKKHTGSPLKKDLHQPQFGSGLGGSHLAIWPSHGLFYDQQTDRWQWQRARLWQTVEDIFPWSFTIGYLVPMLENAGAVVLMPRERDPGDIEVVVDHDAFFGSGMLFTNGSWDTSEYAGFKWSDTLYDGQNPFRLGKSMSVSVIPEDTLSVTYVPHFPVSRDYAVYVSYARTAECISNARYTVNHSGGKAEFTVNQCMGAGTWVYLGKYRFNSGSDAQRGAVVLKGTGTKGILSADAVKFGGGMGNVARKPASDNGNLAKPYIISGKPRWMEGSRYFLQYSGLPDTLVYNLHKNKNDYNDDYMSRPEWVNYLIGSSLPQYNSRYDSGFGIPVDLSLAFHTDAGTSMGDTTIGTLGIYSTKRNNGIFPDGQSKLASRDLTDLVQSQITDDIRKLVDPRWTRRGLWDREYSEAWRPVVPSMLLELLSHQNLADMKYGLDPRFKFIAARSIYKGILRYYTSGERRPAIVQPLPPDNLAMQITGAKKIRLSWNGVDDPIEPTAMPRYFRVYMKTGDNGFDEGKITSEQDMEVELPSFGVVYSFRVTALNEGGESFPSETLSAGVIENDARPVLVVNAFDRICGPAFFDKGDMAGIAWWEDEGVPYIVDHSFTGFQYNFDRNAEWLHDDSPGWGASSAAYEAIAIAGNTFSYPEIHGKAILNAGRSFISVSDEAFQKHAYQVAGFDAIDVIFGEERTTRSVGAKIESEFAVFNPVIAGKLRDFTASGGHVFISGAYIGTDMTQRNDTASIFFAADVLHYTWRSSHATTTGKVYATTEGLQICPPLLHFNTDMDKDFYRVESPDAIEPLGEGAIRICRYSSGNASAGVAYAGNYKSVALGFPFETITDEGERSLLMKMILDFFFDKEGN